MFLQPQSGTAIFLQWFNALPLEGDGYTIVDCMQDLVSLASTPNQSNRVLVPTLQTCAVVLEETRLKHDSVCQENLYDL